MSPRSEARMQDMSPAEVRVRADMAVKFLEVASIVADDESDESLPSVAGALCVLAGIAASDAMCGHVLRRRPRGQDHAQAVTVLGGIRGAEESALALRRLLADKDTSQYGTTYVSRERARAMARRAQVMVDAMEALLGRP